MSVMPAWFAEGVAQYQVPGLGYDTWDSHRDMILRTATLDDKLLSYNEMGVFGDNTLRNEKSYNHGYAFVRYLGENYGSEVVRQITRNMRSFTRYSIDGAIKKATGKEARGLYDDWTSELRTDYASQLRDILPNKMEGETLVSKGAANFYPTWSPDGKTLAYISNNGHRSFSATRLMIFDRESGKSKSVAKNPYYAISWSPDGTALAFANKTAMSKGKSHFYDLYVYDVIRKKKRRLTRGLRAHSPAWSPDGRDMLFVYAKDGTDNIGRLNIETGEIQQITVYGHGEQLFEPCFSPDGKMVLFSMSRGRGRSIYLKDLTTAGVTALVEDNFDARDAVFHDNGRKICFSWDKTGIFNIYEKDLESGAVTQLTNVTGGAFMPSVSADGRLAFALFTSDGYKISAITEMQPVDPSQSHYYTDTDKDVKLASAQNVVPKELIRPINVDNYDDTQLSDIETTAYKNHYSPVAFMPRVMLDYGTMKLGSYFYSSDILNRYSFLAGFDVNRRADYDIFALIEYNNLGPTIFLEGYNQVQHSDVAVDSLSRLLRGGLPPGTEDNYKYDLLEFDAGLKFKPTDTEEIRAAFIFSKYGARLKFVDRIEANLYDQVTLRYDYFIGRDLSLKVTHNGFGQFGIYRINPTGRFIQLGFDREFNKFLTGFEVDNIDGIGEDFQNYNYNKFTLDWKEYLGLPFAKNHALNLDVKAGYIDAKVDSFFNFFAGGMLGVRGYPYYSIEGRKLLMGRLTYRFPLFGHLDARFLHLYFDKVYAGVFFDAGNAFSESLHMADFKKSVGFQLRMDSTSFYSLPTRISFSAAYAMDEFANARELYGKEWRFYFALAFGFFDN
jgi:WD40 repeat protein